MCQSDFVAWVCQGVHLGEKRFRCIAQVAKEAIDTNVIKNTKPGNSHNLCKYRQPTALFTVVEPCIKTVHTMMFVDLWWKPNKLFGTCFHNLSHKSFKVSC